MKRGRSDNDEGRSQSDDSRRDFGVGWRGWFSIHLTGLSERDVRCIAFAISFTIVVAVLIIGFAVVWDRVSTLW